MSINAFHCEAPHNTSVRGRSAKEGRSGQHCTAVGCDRGSYAKGLCALHYQRLRRHGDTTTNLNEPKTHALTDPALRAACRPGFESMLARLTARCEEGPEGCWLWTGALNEAGYGCFRRGPRDPAGSSLVHRATWQCLNEDPDARLHLDHLCRRRNCCNPEHLDLVPARVNLTRGLGPIAAKSRQRRCVRGHVFDEANTYVTKRGNRMCRKCNVIRQKLTRERRLARLAAGVADVVADAP